MGWLVGEVYPEVLVGRSVLDCACNAGGYLFAAKCLGAGRCFGFDAREHWIRRLRRGAAGGADGGPRPRSRIPDTPEARELYERVASIPFWFHSIDLGMNIVIPGLKTPEQHRQELASLRLPELRGKSVLDIGAWDGFYSFAAERLGAALLDDPTNFWAPNAPALTGLCKAAGFSRVELLNEPPTPRRGRLTRYRQVAHAFA